MNTKRLFIAIDISDEARRRASEHIAQLRSVAGVRISWERPEKLHVTLKFLGNVSTKQISDVEETAQTIAKSQAVFSADLAGTGVFPDTRRPRVLWLGIGNDEGKVAALGKATGSGFALLGFPSESRDYSPHLTIARVREPSNGHGVATLHGEMKFAPVRFPVTDLVIYESRLGPTGSVYTVLNRFPFG